MAFGKFGNILLIYAFSYVAYLSDVLERNKVNKIV